ncbi:hypothetical protein [Streptomyces sp. ID05-04B]|uniref:hypothetical protein n=1 Tax=Streptomyces sp. ID05-04B TaxID=3028661 RepID=UPI0029CA9774|nr:hypothetical protein [Streptomyces sp. ID05-04B]
MDYKPIGGGTSFQNVSHNGSHMEAGKGAGRWGGISRNRRKAKLADGCSSIQVDPGNGRSGAPDLASTPAQKKSAANAIEQHLEPDTMKAGAVAEEKTNTAVKEFNGKGGHGWNTSDALKKAHGTWEKQVKALMDRLSADKSALRSTHILFQNQDIDIANKVRQSSNLDGY